MAEVQLSDEDVERIVKRVLERMPKPVTVPIPPIWVVPYIPSYDPCSTWPGRPDPPYKVWCGSESVTTTNTGALIMNTVA